MDLRESTSSISRDGSLPIHVRGLAGIGAETRLRICTGENRRIRVETDITVYIPRRIHVIAVAGRERCVWPPVSRAGIKKAQHAGGIQTILQGQMS
jgi:hypothetical protein